MRGMSIVLALALAGCATTYGGATPRATDEPDTYRFKVYVMSGVGDETALETLKPELEAFRASNGFSSYKVTSRFFDQNGYDYTVRFAK